MIAPGTPPRRRTTQQFGQVVISELPTNLARHNTGNCPLLRPDNFTVRRNRFMPVRSHTDWSVSPNEYSATGRPRYVVRCVSNRKETAALSADQARILTTPVYSQFCECYLSRVEKAALSKDKQWH